MEKIPRQKGAAEMIQANRGRSLEDLVEQYLANEPGVKLFRQANRWVPLAGGARAFPAKGAPVDFVGAVRGIPVVLECKEVSRGSRFPLTESRLPKKEVMTMREFETAGGNAYLLVAFWEKGVLSLYSFPFVESALAKGRKSLASAEGTQVAVSRILSLFDVLQAML
jgi:recombination protein U